MKYRVKVIEITGTGTKIFGYGEIVTENDLNGENIDALLKGGYIEEYGTVIKDSIPEEMPGFELLVEAGMKTMADVDNYGDLTRVKGIGPATAQEINEYLAEYRAANA